MKQIEVQNNHNLLLKSQNPQRNTRLNMKCTIFFFILKTNHQIYTRYEVEGKPMINKWNTLEILLWIGRSVHKVSWIPMHSVEHLKQMVGWLKIWVIDGKIFINLLQTTLDNSHNIHQFTLYLSITHIIFVNYFKQ